MTRPDRSEALDPSPDGANSGTSVPVQTSPAGLPDMPRLLAGIDADEGQPLTRLALRLMVLTLARSADLRRARWAEFSLQAHEWRIAAGRRGEAVRIVPLSRQALDTLLEIRKYRGGAHWLFPGQRDVGRPLSEATLAVALNRAGGPVAPTPGGFRSAARALLRRAGWDVDRLDLRHVLPTVGAHGDDNSGEPERVDSPIDTADAASRAGPLADPQCRRMMQAWADQVDAWRAGGHAPS